MLLRSLLLLFLASPALAATIPTEALRSLVHDHWEQRMASSPTWASSLGDRRWNDQLSDLSFAAIERRHAISVGFLARVRAIDGATLGSGDRLTRDLLEHELSTSVERYGFGMWRLAAEMRSGPHTFFNITRSLPFEHAQDYVDWTARMHRFGPYVDQVIELLRDGIATGIVQPRVIMERVPGVLARQLVKDPATSSFLSPYLRLPATINEAEGAALKRDAIEAVRDTVLPALRRFDAFLRDEYLPACRTTTALSDLPGGRAYYDFLARNYTTTELSAAQIHEIGLAEVARIRGEMERVRAASGFEGDLPAYFEFLRTDPRFFFTKGEDLLTAYRALSRRIDPLLVKVFGTLPRMPYAIEPVPAETAPDTTTAYYNRPAPDGSRPGTFFANLYKPETRPRWEMTALTLHEAMPGHHLQIALSQELGEIPAFRRNVGFTAFVEGWGLYAEFLGEELGLYTDPYDKFGQLTFEMWRSCRLVVDTGMHALGWSRERAIAFMRDNTPRSELDVVNEVDRYIGDPGQALAYKIGELKFKELRTRAIATLGTRFDVRAFHDRLLAQGAVPLQIVERDIDLWITEQAAVATR